MPPHSNTGLTASPWADTLSPAAKTLRTALMSRSCVVCRATRWTRAGAHAQRHRCPGVAAQQAWLAAWGPKIESRQSASAPLRFVLKLSGVAALTQHVVVRKARASEPARKHRLGPRDDAKAKGALDVYSSYRRIHSRELPAQCRSSIGGPLPPALTGGSSRSNG